MTYEESIKYILTRGVFSSQKSLEQIEFLLEHLGNPHKKLKFIHIAGTNGKGSVGKMCSEILQSAGYKVGLFVSPSVIDFRERFQANNEIISIEKFMEISVKIISLVESLKWRGYEITQFEIITAIGIEYFYQEQCDIVCLEVGLGGNMDPTNIIDTPLVAIITAIALDHISLLGDTIEKIACEKAGIIKENTDVVTYPSQSKETLDIITDKCNLTNSRLVVPDETAIKVSTITVLSTKFSYNKTKYKLGLIGAHQVYNATIVLEAMKILNTKGYNITDEVIQTTLKDVRFNARFQVLKLNKFNSDFSKPSRQPKIEPIIILDGSHNQHSFEALYNNIKATGLDTKTFRILVIGMLKDKDVQESLNTILPLFNKIIAVSLNENPRGMSATEIAKKAEGKCHEIYIEPSIKEGIEKAYELAKDDGFIAIAGSLHLSTKVLELYNNS